jgi:phospholipid transport system substrate-binding protein
MHRVEHHEHFREVTGRRGFLRVGLAVGATLAMPAFSIRSLHAAAGSDANAARDFVAGLARDAITVMADGSLAESQRVAQFRELFVTGFDLPMIGQFVLGRHWRAATSEQQARFLKLFERQQVLIWASRFKYFNGQKMTVESADIEAGGGWLVGSRVDSPGGQPIPVDWVVAQSATGWHVTDLSIDGVSLGLTLRQEFAAVLQANGGKFDALLAALQSKIDQLSAG